MAIFIYDLERAADMEAEIAAARKCRELTIQGVSWKDFRYNARTLLNHQVVVMPSGLHHHTKIIETFKAFALLIPGTVSRPLCVHLELWARSKKEQPSAAAAAAPPTQQRAAADGPIIANA